MQRRISARWTLQALKTAATLGAVLVLPILGLLLFRGHSSVGTPPAAYVAQAAPPSSVPDFPNGPLVEGTVTLQDVQFPPLQTNVFSALIPRLEVRYENGELSLVDRDKKVTVWSGSAAPARFVQETIAGIHTLKDAQGRVLWTDADDTPAPDLRLRRAADGQAELTDKSGAILWSGNLPLVSRGSGSRQRNNTYRIEAGGVLIEGEKGAFTVSDAEKRVLWSGQLPEHPVILIHDEHQFHLVTPNRSEGGSDNISQVSITAEIGKVIIADASRQVLGTLPAPILKVEHVQQTLGSSQATTWPVQYKTANAKLATNGTVLLTYLDSTGALMRRARAYRDGNGQGFYST